MCSSPQVFKLTKVKTSACFRVKGRRHGCCWVGTHTPAEIQEISYINTETEFVTLYHSWQLFWIRRTATTMEGRNYLKLSRSTAQYLYGIDREMLPRHWPPTKMSVWIRDTQHNLLIKSDGESPGTNSFLLVLQTRRRQERDEWMNEWITGLYISFLWNSVSEEDKGRRQAGLIQAQWLHRDNTYGKQQRKWSQWKTSKMRLLERRIMLS